MSLIKIKWTSFYKNVFATHGARLVIDEFRPIFDSPQDWFETMDFKEAIRPLYWLVPERFSLNVPKHQTTVLFLLHKLKQKVCSTEGLAGLVTVRLIRLIKKLPDDEKTPWYGNFMHHMEWQAQHHVHQKQLGFWRLKVRIHAIFSRIFSIRLNAGIKTWYEIISISGLAYQTGQDRDTSTWFVFF